MPKAEAKNPALPAREIHITWSDSEWLLVTRELMRLFPELGLPAPDSAMRVRLKHMDAAMLVLPSARRRQLVQLTSVRPRLAQYCARIAGKPGEAKLPQIAPLPSSVVYRQPDGPLNGMPAVRSRIFWTDSEWYAIAVELAYADPYFLDTTNHLQPVDVFRAQRVLPTNRRRAQTSFVLKKLRAELAPAFRRVRAAIEAQRAETAAGQAAAQAEESQRAETASQAAEIASQAAKAEELAQAPAVLAQALSGAAFGPLIEEVLSRGAASLQAILENALVNAFSSSRVKQAMVVHLHMDRAEGPARTFKASAPAVSGSVAVATVVKPKIGIIGALAQQGESIAAGYPQLRIKAIDKNLTGQSLKEAVLNCDRVIGMTSFLSHSIGGVVHKALGDRYTRVDGGVSSVRRQIDLWLSTGALEPEMIQTSEGE